MIKFLIVCVLAGLLFGVMDGLINANPWAQKLFRVYAPIARSSINVTAGILIDIAYGLITGGLFLMLCSALPGESELAKGVVFGLLMWFFRVAMGVISTWMMYEVPVVTLAYIAATGLVEMVVIGAVFGLFLRPF